MKKGFTLIELLAVIVILAVIALIAVPSIMGIITKAKRGGAESSAYNYVKAVELLVATSQIKSTSFGDFEGEYPVDLFNETNLVKGTAPSDGTVSLDTSGIVNNAILCINGFKVAYDGKYANVVSDNCNYMGPSVTDGNVLVERPINTINHETYEGKYFWTTDYSGTLLSISFVNYIDTTGAIEQFDLSAEQNNSIIGWIVEDAKNSGYYNLYIGSTKKIYANPNSSYLFANFHDITLLNLDNFDTSLVTDMSYIFKSLYDLTSLDLSSFNTSNVTNMLGMFSSLTTLTSLDVSNFDTSNVTNMSNMFHDLRLLTTLNLGSFDTSNVTDMSYMFSSMYSLTSLEISSLDTSKVENMNNMFNSLSSITNLDISTFDTSRVTNMSSMFRDMSSITSLNSSSFNTSSVTDMSYMFYGITKITSLNISNFDTIQVTNMSSMFRMDSLLKNIYVGPNWTTSSAYTSYMFYNCGTSTVTLIS
ncbi:MAG: BspA family leucine-rich repeat surface protein [Bacilli bacterium]|nr:BspA family leucine-rich repeat surface protein [Bacilli bacterium]